jgi:hypothetical protein
MQRSILLMVLVVGLLRESVAAQDDSVRTYKTQAPSSSQPPSAKAEPAAAPKPPPADSMPPGLPDRIVLESAHGYVTRRGSVYDFVFDHAAMPEVVAILGQTFEAGIAYSGAAARETSGRYSGRNLDELLLRLVDRTNLHFSANGTIWLLEELGEEAPGSLSLAAVSEATSPTGPASSPAIKDR